MGIYRTNVGTLRHLEVTPISMGSGKILRDSLARALCQYPVGLLGDEQQVELTTDYREGATYLGQIAHSEREDYHGVWLVPI